MRIAIATIVALSLAACATTPSSHLTEGKALADAWAAFDAASTTLDGLATSGVLTPAEKTTIKTDVPLIASSLNAATAAYDSNNDATAAQNVAQASSLIAQLVTIAGSHK